jgi:lipooligosaccharide transport system ATP-binding protein
MKQAGVTVLMSTHYMDEAAVLCDRLAIMHHGKILTEGAPDELVTRHAGSEVAQVRLSNGARQDVVNWIGKAGFEYRETGAVITVSSGSGARPDLSGLEGVRVSYRPSNLEDVFLTMAGRKLTDE